VPSLTDIPPDILADHSPKPIINWLAPMKLPATTKTTFLRLWANYNDIKLTADDYALVDFNDTDNR